MSFFTGGLSLTFPRIKVLHRIKQCREWLADKGTRLKLSSHYYDCSGCPWCKNDPVRSKLSTKPSKPYFTDREVPQLERFISEIHDIPLDGPELRRIMRGAIMPNRSAYDMRFGRLRKFLKENP